MKRWASYAESKRPRIKMNFNLLEWKKDDIFTILFEDEIYIYFNGKFGEIMKIEKEHEDFLFSYIQKGDKNEGKR